MASGTPSAQVRFFPPPPTYAHTILLGGKIIRRRHNYPGRAQVGKKFEKKSEKCRTVPKIPHSISLYIEPNCTFSLYIKPNYTLSLYIVPKYTLS